MIIQIVDTSLRHVQRSAVEMVFKEWTEIFLLKEKKTTMCSKQK